jgi:type IV secretory pathway VirB2 component (pilin)
VTRIVGTLAFVATLMASTSARADHPGPFRVEGMSPLISALLTGALAFAVALVVIVVVMVVTRPSSKHEPGPDQK